MISRWKGISEFKKLLIGSSAALICFILIFQISISPTIKIGREVEQVETELYRLKSNHENPPSELTNRPLINQDVGTVQVELLSLLEQASSNFHVSLESISEPLIRETNGHRMVVIESRSSGRFHDLLKCLHLLEGGMTSLHVQSVKYELIFDRKKRKNILQSTIVFKGLLT